MVWDADTLMAIRDTTIGVVEVAIGLGLVIFVHELGHFVVAKLCGVKCEKFYLGFDIAGLKFCKFRWGETEYGIGILPLGGYVKMLGQEDNPAKIREEIERAKAGAGDGGRGTGGETANCKIQNANGKLPDANPQSPIPNQPLPSPLSPLPSPLYDPRSFLAMSVPKRMAIISAGVIMNLIFACLIAAVAYKIGVRQIAAGIGQIIPGEAAWQANLKVGDEIVEIAGRKIKRFRDMQEAVSLGDLQNGLPITVRRKGVAEPITVTVTPDASGLLPRIGIANPRSTALLKKETAALPGTAAAEAKPPFELGDRIVKIDGQPIDDYAQIYSYLAAHPEKTLKVTVQRTAEKVEKDAPVETREVTIDVPPNPMRRFGLEMEMGEICAIQKDSPAAAAGLKPGDIIRMIDGKQIGDAAVGDSLTLPDRLRRRAGETVNLTIECEDEKAAHEVQVKLSEADAYLQPLDEGSPMAVPALGIAYRVLNRVRAVVPGSPAAEAELLAGDEIVRAKIIPPDAETLHKLKLSQREITLTFDAEHRNWPCFIYAMQNLAPGTEVELEWLRQGASHTATLAPATAANWFNPDRGMLFEPVYVYLTAHTWGEALADGGEETLNATLMVYRTLHKLGSQVSLKALGGPVAIFSFAKAAADEGLANLLIFLTVLSANLAVLNFLPIPLLDGGLMVLLIYEGIRGKPADERVQVALTYVGLAFILVLMVWVCGLDFGLIPRR
jgi:regulator of sigma E protease